MNDPRQAAFLKLKPPCVNLSSVALKFRAREIPVKEVLRALESVRDTLDDLGKAHLLNSKLAEYAFFPLAQQVFNETQRLSPRCLEVAVECVTLLVDYGYGQSLSPELGKQLLILMSMLAGAGENTGKEKPTDDLKVAAFTCISAIIKALRSSKDDHNIFDDQGTKNVVDQLVYLLLESIVENPEEQVQAAASDALLQLIDGLRSRVFLASLLPRTVSSLTKALKTSTQIRRTQRVLVKNLRVFRQILYRTLADRGAINSVAKDEKEILGDSWLNATSTQVKNALIQVCKLRTHESGLVRRALEELCVMVIEECGKSLADSVVVMLESLIVLASLPDGESAEAACKHFVIAYPETAEMLNSSFATWAQSLPRLMQSQDGRAKQLALQKLSVTVPLLADNRLSATSIERELLPYLVNSISTMVQETPSKAIELQNGQSTLSTLTLSRPFEVHGFDKFLLNHESQRETVLQLQQLITKIRQIPEHNRVTRQLIDSVADDNGSSQLASFWLALQLLHTDGSQTYDISDLLFVDNASVDSTSRSSVLADLHATTFPLLSSAFGEEFDTPESYRWQLQALALEALTMYAQTFPSDTYRPELVDTLYPVLSFLGSPNAVLRSHAMTALHRLAHTCQYSSTQDLLIQNVDYLVNSISWKLNTYSISPEAPQILRMMVDLCGAELVPYLDDLIQSIFAALDSYHGYPEWVELLFQTLKSMVDVSIKQPQLAITQGKEPNHAYDKAQRQISATTDDILSDLQGRRQRKKDFGRSADEAPTNTPHRPWTNALDGPSFPKPADATDEQLVEQDDGDGQLAPTKAPEEENERKLSKTHTLLLNIATSTVPHLVSPSPSVRQLLLDLLNDISPLLSGDEDSFLPLINTIWPVVVPRLFADQDDDEETAYNIAAAAETVATLCKNAGDFMASRVEDIVQQLARLFKSVLAKVNVTSTKSKSDTAVNPEEPRKAIRDSMTPTGAVRLQVVENANSQPVAEKEIERARQRHPTRSSKSQILASLINLLLAILSHVRLSLDSGDELMRLLLPLMTTKPEIKPVLETYNSDAVWLWELKQRIRDGKGKHTASLVGIEDLEADTTNEQLTRSQGGSILRRELQDRGFKLLDPVSC